MLENIVNIENVGAFERFEASGSFERVTLLHGGNGAGKSTLAEVLRACAAGRAVRGRRPGAARVELAVSDARVAFAGETWSGTAPAVAVFDDRFVADNVHVWPSVEIAQRKRLHGLLVGAPAAALARRFEQVSSRARELSQEALARRRRLERGLPEGVGADALAAPLPGPAEPVRPAEPPRPSGLAAPAAPHAALALVERHARERGLRPGWLAEGRRAQAGPACPYCAQDTAGVALVEALGAAFDPVPMAAGSGERCAGPDRELASLEVAAVRRRPEVAVALAALADLDARRAAIEREKVEARAELERSSAAMLASHEAVVNELLGRLRAGFRVCKLERSFAGGNPSIGYHIRLEGARSSPVTRCFGDTLGAGDRAVLALAFFFSALAHEARAPETVVVLDDPFSALDDARAAALCGVIADAVPRFAQVLVMSRDARPLRLVASGWRDSALFRLVTDAGRSRLIGLGSNGVPGAIDMAAGAPGVASFPAR